MKELRNAKHVITINPEQGGALVGWSYKAIEGKAIHIMSPDFGYPSQSSWLFPFPNRLKNGEYEFAGENFQFPLNDFGRPNALHGFLSACKFEVVESIDSRLSLRYSYLGDRSYYPFPFTFNVDYGLVEQGIEVNIVIENGGPTSMPAALGWHPYFSTDNLHDCSLKIGQLEHIEVDEFGIPNGQIQSTDEFSNSCLLADRGFDHCFRLVGESTGISLLQLNQKLSIEVHQSKEFNYIQLYTPDRKAIAIEPMTSGINSLQTGDCKILSPGEIWQLSCGLRIREA